VVLTTSTSEAYGYLFRLLCDAGDEVLVAQPSYPLFDFLADLEDVRLKSYPLFYDMAGGSTCRVDGGLGADERRSWWCIRTIRQGIGLQRGSGNGSGDLRRAWTGAHCGRGVLDYPLRIPPML